MDRRKFVYTSCGVAALSVVPGLWNILHPAFKKRKFNICRYKPESFDLEVPVYKITPDDGHYNFTYYDIPAHSPSGRYIAVTRVPFVEDRLPKYGETAEVCVIDLDEETISTVYETKSWGFQTGALLHWGPSDRYLYTNDVFGSQNAVCVQIDLDTGKFTAFDGPMYNIAPNGQFVVGFPLELLNVTQQGYGLPSRDPENPDKLPYGAATDEGIWKTDLATNWKSLLMSLADVAARIPVEAPEKDGTYYFWHTKVNPQSTKILQVFRCLFPSGLGGRNPMVFTYNTDGTGLKFASGELVWGQGGGHPNWHPDGVHIIRVMNPEGSGGQYRYCQFLYDGSGFKVLSNKIKGEGHPRITPDSRFITTDDFPVENGQQKLRIKLIDLISEEEVILVKMNTSERDGLKNATIRLDGHPTWDRNYKKLAFQAAPDGKRQVFVADLSDVV
ncbi:hypothetical protein D1164_07585 [Mariniphaga sediminis]|uniref:Uncharacterized protein n=1 Tax=Mariniphaga sediminis TaxID=1628158 RepID=A0A399D3X9_9BACT|nr:hypothetical protein [Mariniphaga sediminis]RIH66113.1 hypothetical protein D1164_07585 [Mariniphaga sediminis]